MADSAKTDTGQARTFGELAKQIQGKRLASVTEKDIQSLQSLAVQSGQAGISLIIAERDNGNGLHPRVESIEFAPHDILPADLIASDANSLHVISFGTNSRIWDVLELLFDLDVQRLPFDEAARMTAGKRLAVARHAKIRSGYGTGGSRRR